MNSILLEQNAHTSRNGDVGNPATESVSQRRKEPEPRPALRFNWGSALAALAAAALLGTGCATNSRYVLLKEYGPTVPARPDQPLKGTTVCIKGFQCAPALSSPDPKTQPEQPPGFSFVQFTQEQGEMWDKEFKAMKKSSTKADWREIGNVRNMLGMVMSHVYALNDPGAWLADTLKMDLESQGAKVLDASQSDSADITLSGTIQFCRVDLYMKIWGDLVVDLELQPKGGSASHSLLHTDGGRVAWVASTFEFYVPLRESRQKFSWLATREILKALGRQSINSSRVSLQRTQAKSGAPYQVPN